MEENWLKAFSSRTFEFAVHHLTFHTMLCIRLSADPIDYEANLIWFVGNWKCMQETFIFPELQNPPKLIEIEIEIEKKNGSDGSTF